MARISLVDEKSVGALVWPGKDCIGSTVYHWESAVFSRDIERNIQFAQIGQLEW